MHEFFYEKSRIPNPESRIPNPESPANDGFTLIEISIVLVIIGLIVGGILVGQSLIKAAELRATIKQYEQFNTAANMFRLKYDGLPGDLIYNKAVAFGFVTSVSWYTHINDGDGVLRCRDSVATFARSNPCGEILFFWRYLSDAKLISGSYSPNLVTPTEAYPANASADSAPVDLFPKVKTGSNTYWVVGNDGSGNNYYGIISMTGVAGNAAYYHNSSDSLGFTPMDAYAIDSKIDDGKPNTGTVQARGTTTFIEYNGPAFYPMAELNASIASSFATTPVSGTCQTGVTASTDTANIYATNTNVSANAYACNLRLRFN